MRSILPSSALLGPAFGTVPGSTLKVLTRSLPMATVGSAAGPWIQPSVVLWHLKCLWARRYLLLHSFRACSPSRGFSLTACCSSSTLRLRGCCSFCVAPRAQYALRTLPPADTRAYAAGHDAAVFSCLDALLHADNASGLPALAAARAQLALCHGGLGLRSAERHAVARRGLLGIMFSPPSRAETEPSLKPSRA